MATFLKNQGNKKRVESIIQSTHLNGTKNPLTTPAVKRSIRDPLLLTEEQIPMLCVAFFFDR